MMVRLNVKEEAALVSFQSKHKNPLFHATGMTQLTKKQKD